MNTEEKKKYFAEAALALNREGFRAEMFHGNKLSVWWDDELLCEISDGGAVHYHSSDLQTPEQNEAKDRAYQITCTVFEYMCSTTYAVFVSRLHKMFASRHQ